MNVQRIVTNISKMITEQLSIFEDKGEPSYKVSVNRDKEENGWNVIEISNADTGVCGQSFCSVPIKAIDNIVGIYESRYKNELNIFWNIRTTPTECLNYDTNVWVYQPIIVVHIQKK